MGGDQGALAAQLTAKEHLAAVGTKLHDEAEQANDELDKGEIPESKQTQALELSRFFHLSENKARRYHLIGLITRSQEVSWELTLHCFSQTLTGQTHSFRKAVFRLPVHNRSQQRIENALTNQSV